jgi:uncharacterized protein
MPRLFVVMEKYERLQELLRSYGSCLVAYSGGVDSVLLARVAHEVLGRKALAAIADSPSLPRRELQEALALAEQFQFPVRVVRTKEFENPAYLANPNNRCYFCKHELFTELGPLAKAEGFAVVAYGENASDVGDYRPGAQAAVEFQVRAPLKEAGLTKAEIRQLSAQLGLPTAEKAQMACLSSRIPYGERVTEEKLRMIERAENLLRDLGFYDVRVRHHELGGGNVPKDSGTDPLNFQRKETPRPGPLPLGRGEGELSADGSRMRVHGEGQPQPPMSLENRPRTVTHHLARIEVGPGELSRFLENGLAARVSESLKEIGYAHVTLDLQGYRRGSLNEAARGGKKGTARG